MKIAFSCDRMASCLPRTSGNKYAQLWGLRLNPLPTRKFHLNRKRVRTFYADTLRMFGIDYCPRSFISFDFWRASDSDSQKKRIGQGPSSITCTHHFCDLCSNVATVIIFWFCFVLNYTVNPYFCEAAHLEAKL